MQVKLEDQETRAHRQEDEILSKDGDSEPKATSLIQIKARNLMREGMTKVMETGGDFAGFDAGHDGFIGNNHNGGEWVDSYSR